MVARGQAIHRNHKFNLLEPWRELSTNSLDALHGAEGTQFHIQSKPQHHSFLQKIACLSAIVKRISFDSQDVYM